jgi:hypothetical protein
MGDRCYFEATVHPDDAETFGQALGLGPHYTVEEAEGRFVLDEVNYGAVQQLEQAAAEGLRFYGYTGPGQDYGAGLFACWAGELHAIACDTQGAPMVRFDWYTERARPEDLDRVRAYFKAREDIKRALDDDDHEQPPPPCGHSACRQYWIDTGRTACVQKEE